MFDQSMDAKTREMETAGETGGCQGTGVQEQVVMCRPRLTLAQGLPSLKAGSVQQPSKAWRRAEP